MTQPATAPDDALADKASAEIIEITRRQYEGTEVQVTPQFEAMTRKLSRQLTPRIRTKVEEGWPNQIKAATEASADAHAKHLTASHDRHLSELRHSFEVRERHVRSGARSFGGLVGLAIGLALGAGGVAWVYKDVNLVNAAADSMQSRSYAPPTVSDAEQYWDSNPDMGVSRPGRAPASAP